MSYRKSQDRYVLYSVGPDGQDDGGTSIQNLDRSENLRYTTFGNSHGDIVAGINR
jgi:hypothetical protein